MKHQSLLLPLVGMPLKIGQFLPVSLKDTGMLEVLTGENRVLHVTAAPAKTMKENAEVSYQSAKVGVCISFLRINFQ